MGHINLSEHLLLWCFSEEDAYSAAKKIAHKHNLAIDNVYVRRAVFRSAQTTYTFEGWYAKFRVEPAATPS